MFAPGPQKLSSDQAARKTSQGGVVGPLACVGRLQFVAAVFGLIKRLISSWPLQHCLMKALSVNHTLMSEHHFTLFHHSNWDLCPVRFGQHIQRLSSSILSVGCENEKKKEYISRTVVKVILKYKYYAIRNNCVLERRLTRRTLRL